MSWGPRDRFPKAGSKEQEELSSRYRCPAVVTERVGSC